MTDKQIPEQAKVTGQVDRILDPMANEILWFHLKKGDENFCIGLTDILKCLKFAEEQGEVPPIDPIWGGKLANLYCMDELLTF